MIKLKLLTQIWLSNLTNALTPGVLGAVHVNSPLLSTSGNGLPVPQQGKNSVCLFSNPWYCFLTRTVQYVLSGSEKHSFFSLEKHSILIHKPAQSNG